MIFNSASLTLFQTGTLKYILLVSHLVFSNCETTYSADSLYELSTDRDPWPLLLAEAPDLAIWSKALRWAKTLRVN